MKAVPAAHSREKREKESLWLETCYETREESVKSRRTRTKCLSDKEDKKRGNNKNKETVAAEIIVFCWFSSSFCSIPFSIRKTKQM